LCHAGKFQRRKLTVHSPWCSGRNIRSPNRASKLDRTEQAASEKEKEALYNKLLKGKLDHLTPEDRLHIEPVLVKYAHIFHDEETNDFKGTTVIEHEIQVGDAQPIRRPPYRTPYALREEMERQVQDMLKKGVIRESNSPWSA
jgi:hypothetical protein